MTHTDPKTIWGILTEPCYYAGACPVPGPSWHPYQSEADARDAWARAAPAPGSMYMCESGEAGPPAHTLATVELLPGLTLGATRDGTASIYERHWGQDRSVEEYPGTGIPAVEHGESWTLTVYGHGRMRLTLCD